MDVTSISVCHLTFSDQCRLITYLLSLFCGVRRAADVSIKHLRVADIQLHACSVVDAWFSFCLLHRPIVSTKAAFTLRMTSYVVVLTEHVQRIGGIHTTRDVVRRRTSWNAEIETCLISAHFCTYDVVWRSTSLHVHSQWCHSQRCNWG